MKRWFVVVVLVGCGDNVPTSHDAPAAPLDVATCTQSGASICETATTLSRCSGTGEWSAMACAAGESCHECVQGDAFPCAFCYTPPGEPCVPDALNTASNCVDSDTARICRGTPSDGYIWVYEECPSACHVSTGTLGFCV